MTACRNKARGAVVAALAGALTLGAAPVMALADGASLMEEATPDQAFDRGTVVEFKVGKSTVKDSADAGEIKMSAIDKNLVTITSVRPDGVGADAQDASKMATFYYKKADAKTGTHQINGAWYTYVGKSADSDIVDKIKAAGSGDYIAAVTKGGIQGETVPGTAANVQAPAVSFKVVSDSLDDVTIAEPIYDANGAETGEYSETFAYDSRTTWGDVILMLDGEEFNSGDFEAYAAEDDEANLNVPSNAMPVQAGDYKIVIKGTGDYEGERTIDLHVDKLDLSKADLYLDDVVMGSVDDDAPDFADIKGSGVAAIEGAQGTRNVLCDTYFNLDIKGNTWGSDKAGEYTYELTVDADEDAAANVTGTATLKFNRLNENAATVDWTYDGQVWVRSDQNPSAEIDIDRSQAKDDFTVSPWLLKDFDASKLAGSYEDANGKTVSLGSDDFTVTIRDEDGNVVDGMDKKGVYIITVEAKSANFDWDVTRSVSRVTATVISGTVGDADTVFTYEGEVKSGTLETTYDGQDVLARLGVQVKDTEGNVLTEGEDYVVTARNTDTDEVVEEIVDAGNYEVVVSSDYYELEGDVDGVEKLEVTVKQFEMDANNTRVVFPTMISYEVPDGMGGTVVDKFIPYTGEEIVPVVEVALTTDENDDPVWSTLDPSLYVLGNEYADKAGSGTKASDDPILAEGWYKVLVSADEDATANFTGDVQFGSLKGGYFHVTDDVKVFADVPNDEYYSQSVYTAANQGYIKGMSGSNLFMPNRSISRADMVVVLYRMAGGSVDDEGVTDADRTYISKFGDVDEGAYYARALAWATKAGIVTGYEDGNFGPADDVTVEQFVTMLARYAEVKGDYEAVDADEVLGTVADGDQVSEFGQDAVAWAIDNGYLAQGGADVQPQTPVSRGRAVTIAVRYQPAKAQIVGAVK